MAALLGGISPQALMQPVKARQIVEAGCHVGVPRGYVAKAGMVRRPIVNLPPSINL